MSVKESGTSAIESGDLVASALWYARQGIPVFPLRPESKKPATAHGFKDATKDPEAVKLSWQEMPDANIGIPTGRASGLIALDVDPRAGGDRELERLIAEYGPLPETAEQITGGGGRHYIFRCPEGQVRSRNLGPGVELKAEASYIVASPSIHPATKRRYQWDGLDGEGALCVVASVPDWIRHLSEQSRPREHLGDSEKIPEGQRNKTLTSLAGSMRRRGMSREAIEAALLAENTSRCEPPLPEEEVRRIAASVSRYEPADRPGDPTEGGVSGVNLPAVAGMVSEVPLATTPEELIQKIQDVDDDHKLDVVFNHVELMASLSPGEWGKLRSRLKQLLGGALDLNELKTAVGQARRLLSRSAIGHSNDSPYEVRDGSMVYIRQTTDGPAVVPLSNFAARIVAEMIHDDGVERKTFFEIDGSLADGNPLPRVLVRTDEYNSMGWVTRHWGMRAVVYAGQANRDHLRAAIQITSRNAPRRVVFAHLGRLNSGKRPLYVHAGGAIGPDGPEKGVEVSVPDALSAYELPDPPGGAELRRALRASLDTLRVSPHRITAPVLGGVVRVVLGAADFGIHLSGPTGVGKTELLALGQQHFGAGMDSRNLPGSWSSTGNALEALAFAAKDALLAVDDFAPTGSVYDVQRYHREADRLIRAQGNRAGRLRLRSDATFRPAKRPRGLILSSGEDIPRGESLRARLLTVEVAPLDVNWRQMSVSQRDAREGLLAQALAAFIQWVARDYEGVQERLRSSLEELRGEALKSSAHKRTPQIIANLGAGLRLFLEFANEVGAITPAEQKGIWKSIWSALGETALAQAKLSITVTISVILDSGQETSGYEL